MSDILQTEFEFELPLGYVDKEGNRNRSGTMRLATAADEILPLKDSRVQSNPAYLSIILLARVITRLDAAKVNTYVIENLYARDFEYLQDLYNRINKTGSTLLAVTCPKCEHAFEAGDDAVGET